MTSSTPRPLHVEAPSLIPPRSHSLAAGFSRSLLSSTKGPHMKVTDILASIDQKTMALPEFQRGYVWSRDQVRSFMPKPAHGHRWSYRPKRCARGSLVECRNHRLERRWAVSPLMRPRWGRSRELGSCASSAPPSSSCPRFARIVFAKRENAARKSGRYLVITEPRARIVFAN